VPDWNKGTALEGSDAVVECNDVSGNENGGVRAASPVPAPNSEFAPSLFIRTQIFADASCARNAHGHTAKISPLDVVSNALYDADFRRAEVG
jgi:hypothetical protein